MKNFKKNKVSSVILMVFSIAFLLTVVLNIFYTRYIHIENIIISIIPVILYGISLYISLAKNKTVKWTRFSNLFNLIIFICVILFNFSNMMLNDSLKPIDNIKDYKRLMRIYDRDKNEYINHFPKDIPYDAANISFHESSNEGDGGSKMLLSFKSNDEDIKKEKERLINISNFKVNEGKEEANLKDVPKEVLDFKKDNYEVFIGNIKEETNSEKSITENWGVIINKDNTIMYWSFRKA